MQFLFEQCFDRITWFYSSCNFAQLQVWFPGKADSQEELCFLQSQWTTVSTSFCLTLKDLVNPAQDMWFSSVKAQIQIFLANSVRRERHTFQNHIPLTKSAIMEELHQNSKRINQMDKALCKFSTVLNGGEWVGRWGSLRVFFLLRRDLRTVSSWEKGYKNKQCYYKER